MANWDSYTQKATPKDNDTLMIKDTEAGANKRTPFSGVWNWMVGKLTSAVISQLETQNKSIIPAINELNSKIMSLNNADIDNLDRSKPFVIGTLTTDSKYIDTYPALGTFMQIRGNSMSAASQFIFASSGKIYYRRYYNSAWNDWYLFNGTIVKN